VCPCGFRVEEEDKRKKRARRKKRGKNGGKEGEDEFEQWLGAWEERMQKVESRRVKMKPNLPSQWVQQIKNQLE